LASDTHRALLSTGIAIYGGCKTITAAASDTASATADVGAGVWESTRSGVAFAARGVGAVGKAYLDATVTATMFTLRIPGNVAGTVANSRPVSAVIRPAEDEPLPVIDAETSAAVLAKLSGLQQQQVADQLAEQLAANQKLEGTVLAGDQTHGGYPAKWDNIPQDSTVDSWGMYNRECVSYAAWKVYQTYGSMPYWGGIGNANQWLRNAINAGIPTGTTPKVNSVAISMYGYYGHAMWVEAVEGNRIYVSQYNYDLQGHYSEMWVDASSLSYIYFQ
jgi:surface antigen